MDGSYSVIFQLCYKKYEYKTSFKASKDFKDSTGLDLWGVLLDYVDCYIESMADGNNTAKTLSRLSKVIDKVDASHLFHSLAKQCGSVSLEEIQDAMEHAGILPTDVDNGMGEPYPIVLYMLALEIIDYHKKQRSEAKKQ